MYENNYSENKEYPDLTPEQNKILAEINDILRLDNRDRCVEVYEKRMPQIVDFMEKFQKKGLDLNDYILGRRLKFSTPEEGIFKFDTPDHEIEKFIRTLEK